MSGRILIVDDVSANRILLQARLGAACYETIVAADGAECLAIAQSHRGRHDLILLDLALPDMPGPSLLRALRADPRSRDIPVIGLAATEDEGARLAAFAAGVDDVIAKPALDRVLLARVRNLLRARAEIATEEGLVGTGFAEPPALFDPAGKIALITTCRPQATEMQTALAQYLRDTLVVLDPAQALDETVAGGADIFVLDLPPGALMTNALRLLSELKSRLATRHAAVCLTGISALGDDAAMAYDLGADDVVGTGFSALELALRLRALLRRKRNCDRQRVRMADGLRLALIDPLTGLFNRRHAIPELRAIAHRACAENSGYAVLVADIDRFKSVNDGYGHAAGDSVLVEVAQRLRQNLREGDLLARIGGEEFLIAVPGSTLAEAQLVAERLCAAIDRVAHPLPLSKAAPGHHGELVPLTTPPAFHTGLNIPAGGF